MTDTPTTAQLVAMIGEALYGDRWVSDLARRLKVQMRTMERVARAARDGLDYRGAANWLDDLDMALQERAGDIVRIRALLEPALLSEGRRHEREQHMLDD